MAKQTQLTKRRLIESAGKMVFVWVAIAAGVVSLVLVALQFVYQDFAFHNQIIGAKSKADSTLSANIKAVETLDAEIKKLIANGDLAKTKAYAEQTTLSVILDALPSNPSVTDLPAALQKNVAPKAGVSLVGISVPGGATVTPPTDGKPTKVEPVEQSYAIEVAGNYDAIKAFIQQLERSIRPMHIVNLSVQGNSDRELRASLMVMTYYQPSKTITIEKRTLKQ